jgi:hypothetical protein
VTGIDSRNLTIALPGSGTIDAGGNATRFDVTISGDGGAQLRRLIAHDVKATLGGDGTIMLTATKRLTARVSGTGTILYGGSPAHVPDGSPGPARSALNSPSGGSPPRG